MFTLSILQGMASTLTTGNLPSVLAGVSLIEEIGGYRNLLLTEFEVLTVSYGPSFFSVHLWPKRKARGP